MRWVDTIYKDVEELEGNSMSLLILVLDMRMNGPGDLEVNPPNNLLYQCLNYGACDLFIFFQIIIAVMVR